MNNLRKAAEQALEALETVTKQMLKVRDELAERGARPVTNKAHQALWDSSFASYTDAAIPAATALREALAKPADSGCAFPMCHNKDYQEAVAAQVMAELYTGIVVPPGYALVPVELTDAMADASGAEEAPGKCMFDVASQRWRDMLAAAPQFDAAKLKGGA